MRFCAALCQFEASQEATLLSGIIFRIQVGLLSIVVIRYFTLTDSVNIRVCTWAEYMLPENLKVMFILVLSSDAMVKWNM
jgi:hypothetical protein